MTQAERLVVMRTDEELREAGGEYAVAIASCEQVIADMRGTSEARRCGRFMRRVIARLRWLDATKG